MNIEDLVAPLPSIPMCSACEPDMLQGDKPTVASLEQLIHLVKATEVIIKALEAAEESQIEQQADKE